MLAASDQVFKSSIVLTALITVQTAESDKIRLEREISELAEKLDLLASQTGAKCPLCETELTQEGLERIAANYNEEKQVKSDLLKSNQVELAQKKTELESLQKDISQLDSQLNQEKSQKV